MCVCHFVHTIVHFHVELHFHLLAKNVSCIFIIILSLILLTKQQQFKPYIYIYWGNNIEQDHSHSRWTCESCVSGVLCTICICACGSVVELFSSYYSLNQPPNRPSIGTPSNILLRQIRKRKHIIHSESIVPVACAAPLGGLI